MNLDELTSIPCVAPEGAAPDWLFGVFHRRSITFFTGVADTETEVYWLQSRGLSADFRLSRDRPRRDGRNSLAEFSREELVQIAANEGGLARTRWDNGRMTWFDWTAFQIHDKWAEPGDLRRVGDCVIELAPSGAYVEDWRLQPSYDGPLIGLRLLTESNLETGDVLHRGGGLIVCGNHAAFVRGRAVNLPDRGKLTGAVGRMSRDEALHAILSFDASYGTRLGAGSPFLVDISTNPLREGHVLISEDGFSHDAKSGLVRQRTSDNGVPVERVFEMDTLQAHTQFCPSTAASLEGKAWLHREADTLLTHASMRYFGQTRCSANLVRSEHKTTQSNSM